MKQRRLVSLDIETKSKTNDKEDALNPFKNEITCIGVHEFGKVYRAPWDDFMEEVYNNDDLEFVGHNLKWDLKQLHFHFGPMPNVMDRYADDTRFMAYVLTEKVSQEFLVEYEERRKQLNAELPTGYSHREAGLHSLKTLAPYFLGVEAFWEDPTNHDSDEYVLKDTQYTAELREYLQLKLESLGQYDFYKNKVMPWARMILKAELTGVVCDKDTIVSLMETSTKELRAVEKELRGVWSDHYNSYTKLVLDEITAKYEEMYKQAAAKKPDQAEKLKIKYAGLSEKAVRKAIDDPDQLLLNLDSPTQLAWLLKDQLNLDIKNLQGKDSTDKEVLQRLAKQDKNVEKLLTVRKLSKLTTAFFPKYLDLMHKGRIHASYNIDGTRTGRLSSSDPNMQQHPRDLKYIFKASTGRKLITYDLGSIEAVLMAHYTQDIELMQIVKDGRSVHDVNTIEMFQLNCAESEVKKLFPDLRYAAKQIGFSVLYGAGWNQVRMSCYKFGILKTEHECREIVKRIRKKFSGVWEFKQALDAELEKGEILYNLLGRPIQFTNPEEVYMKGFNRLIQGSASDLCLDIAHEISLLPGCTPIMFVHDSIVTEVDSKVSMEPVEETDLKIQKIFRRTLASEEKSIMLSIEGGVSEYWE